MVVARGSGKGWVVLAVAVSELADRYRDRKRDPAARDDDGDAPE